LKEQDRALGGPTPHKLAAFALAILDIDIAAGIFQAAILENAINVHSVIQHHMLVFEYFVLVTHHKFIERLREKMRAAVRPAASDDQIR
jgi:hypothetical protein